MVPVSNAWLVWHSIWSQLYRWEKLNRVPHLSVKSCTLFNLFFLSNMTNWHQERFFTVSSPAPSTCVVPSKTYHSVAGNVVYKDIPSLLLPHPLRRSNTSLPPTLSRPSCRFKRCILHVKISFCWSQVRHSHGQQKLYLSTFRDSNIPCVMKPKKCTFVPGTNFLYQTKPRLVHFLYR